MARHDDNATIRQSAEPGTAQRAPSRFRDLALAVMLAALLCACAGPSSRSRLRPEMVPPQTGGYAPAALASELSTTSHQWLVDGHVVDLLLSEPAQPQMLPVVVYLPGLGESRMSGDRWRTAWAAAGYAVVSVQPLRDDEAAWLSPLARNGEFKALGRERYGAEATRQRLAVLRSILRDAVRRTRAGEAAWQRIAWDRAALAGFDLGAYTAMALADGDDGTGQADATAVRFRAVVAISPYASVTALPVGRGIASGAAVLAIGSDADGDPLGIVDNGPRAQPLDGIRGPDRYVLWMADLTHANLGGSATADQASERQADAASKGERAKDKARRGQRGGPPGTGGKGEEPAFDHAELDIEAEPLLPADAIARRRQAIQLSTAFLDATVGDDARAREWLARSASSWLGPRGELRRPVVGTSAH